MNPMYGIDLDWAGLGLFHLLALGGAVLFLFDALFLRRRSKRLPVKAPEEGA